MYEKTKIGQTFFTVEINSYTPVLMRNSTWESTGTRHPVLTSSGSPVHGRGKSFLFNSEQKPPRVMPIFFGG